MPKDVVPSVLRAFAELSASAQAPAALVIAPFDELQTINRHDGLDGTHGLLDARYDNAVSKAFEPFGGGRIEREPLPVRVTPATERLAQLDALHAEEVLLRHSWVLVVGTVPVDGRPSRVLQPLLSRPIRLHRQGVLRRTAGFGTGAGPFDVDHLGEAEVSSWIDDPEVRARQLEGAAFGRGAVRSNTSEALLARMGELTGWIRTTAAAAGWHVTRIVAPSEDPADWIDRPGLVAIPVHSIHTVRQVNVTSLRSTLSAWAGRRGIDATAMAAMLQPPGGTADGGPSGTIDSQMLLSPSQREVVRRSRTEPLTVVSGAPGSGKTHALCAVAFDTVSAGGSVLVVTQSRHATEAVAEILRRVPGPAAVRFGDGAGMASLIDELNDRTSRPLDHAEVRALDTELDLASAAVEALRSAVGQELALESDAQHAAVWADALPSLIVAAPEVFRLDSDLDALDELVQRATSLAARSEQGGWLARWRAGRARRRLDRATGAAGSTTLVRIANAVDAARAGRAAAALETRGGTDLGAEWGELAAADHRRRDALGRRRRVAPFEESVLDTGARYAIGDLIAALRAGRSRRRALLAAMPPGDLTAAAPLWLGTLSDVEDVLPATAALFDLVILDEASQIEQTRAAPALLRARRAVVVGDPRQLRHVSFRSDDDIERVIAQHGLQDLRGRLDLRRVSAFDLAATAAPVDVLREHFRSVPHLIEFSVRTFYRDRVDIMTRHPRNESLDAIDVRTVAPPSSGTKVHRDEIDAALELLLGLDDGGVHRIGVISPFRDQADALEAAILEHFDAARIARLGLRVGTVHSFQGGERDTVIVSLALAPDDPPGRRRFVEQSDLFNVMVTRARERVVVVTSLGPGAGGLCGDYLRHAESPLSPVATARGGSPTGWRDELAAELRRTNVVRVDYPVGPWLLDLVLGDGDDAVMLDCAVHPDGVDAHIERRLSLMGLGWTIVDAFPSRWEGNAARAALELG